MEKSRRRPSISFSLALHILVHLVAAVAAQSEQHQVLDGAEGLPPHSPGLWEPRFGGIIGRRSQRKKTEETKTSGVNDRDSKNEWEKRKKAKAMEETRGYSKTRGNEPMEMIGNGTEETKMTQRIFKPMSDSVAEICALGNLSADLSYPSSVKMSFDKFDALPSHLSSDDFVTILKTVDDGASSGKVTRLKVSSVIPNQVSILSWLRHPKDWKGAHGPTQNLHQMFYSLRTIGHPVAVPGEMVKSSLTQNTDNKVWAPYQANRDHRRMRRTSADSSQENIYRIISDETEMCGSETSVLVNAILNKIAMPVSCMSYVCFSKGIHTFSNTKYGFWFNESDQTYKGLCYSETDDCSKGKYYLKSFMISATEKILVSAPECWPNSIPFLQIFLYHHRVKLPSECLLFLCSSNIQYLRIAGALLFYSTDPLAPVQLGCLSSILESTASNGETSKGNNFDAADDSACYNEAATLTYGASSDFPFENPCETASITISVPSEMGMVILVRGSHCKYFDDGIGLGLLGIYLQGRLPIEEAHLYTCLTKKESDRVHLIKTSIPSIVDKYLLTKAQQDGVISERVIDLCCHNESSLVAMSDKTGARHMFFSMNGPIKSWLSYDNFIKNISSFTTTIEPNSPLPYSPKASSIPNMKTQVLPIPISEYNKTPIFFLYTDWVSWCPQKQRDWHSVINEALFILALYNPELSRACQHILCSARIGAHGSTYNPQVYFWHNGPPSSVDKKCLNTARLNKVSHYENDNLAILHFNNTQSFRTIVIFFVKNEDNVFFYLPSLGKDLTLLLREGKHKYIDCLSSLASDQTTRVDVARMFFVNGTQWQLCLGKGETHPSSSGQWDWIRHVGSGSRAFLNSSSLWVEEKEYESYQPSDDSLKDWYEIIDSKSPIISGISKRLFGKKMEFLAFLIQACIRFNHTTLEDLVTRYRTTTEYNSSLTFVFEMPLDVFKGHPIVKENEGIIDCITTSFYSTCPNIIGHSLMFVHKCSVSYNDNDKLFGMYLAAIVLRIEKWNICSSSTLVFSSHPLDRNRILYSVSGNEEAIARAMQRVKKILHGWTLERRFFIFRNRFNARRCITVPQGARLESIIRMGFCIKVTVDAIDFYFERALNETLSVFILEVDKNRNIPTRVDFIKYFTGLDVNLLKTLRAKNKCDIDKSGLSCRENQIAHVNVYKADFSIIIANLEKRLGVDTETLLTDIKYEWSLRSNLQTAANAISGFSSSCMSDVVDGKSVLYRKDNITFITGIFEDLSLGSCFTSLPKSVLREIDEAFLKKRGTINKFWPTCGIQDAIVIGRDPSSSEWFYLSSGCRLKQIFLFLITLAITVITISGNLFILLIIHRYDMALILQYGPPFYILRSLAVADLLTGVFPGLLALWDQVSLMTGYMTLYDLEEDGVYGGFFNQRLQLAEGFQELRFERHGYPMFCGLVLSVTSIVSLLMLLLLSVERYKGVKYQTFRCFHVVVAVWVSWVFAILFAILLFVRKDGFNSAGYFDPISKLTVSIGSSGTSLSQLIFYLEIIFVSVAGCGMILLTFYTFYTFIGFRTNREKSNIILTTGNDQNVHQQDRKYFIFFFLLVLLYVISCLPLAANIFGGFSQKVPVFQFFAWWSFMVGSSWNWYIYTYVRKPFQENMNKWIEKRRRLQNLQNL